MSQLDFSQALHLLNPSGSKRRAIEKFFKKNPGLSRVWVNRDQHPTHLETLIEWALKEKRRRFFVWGGDGTFNRTIQAFREQGGLRDVEVGLIPAGTCNDFSRKISPGSWKKTAGRFRNRPIDKEKIDVGLLKFDGGERVFINNAGFGRKPLAPGKKSNPIQDIASFESRSVQVEWGTHQLHQFEQTRLFLGIIFNSPFFNCGMYFDKNISPKDGILNGFLVPPQPKGALLGRFIGSRFGMSLGKKSDLTLESSFINIEAEEPLYPQVDGEWASREGTRRLAFTILPDKLSLLVPAAG